MLFVLEDLDRGDLLGEFDSAAEAASVLDRILATEPLARSDLGVVPHS